MRNDEKEIESERFVGSCQETREKKRKIKIDDGNYFR